MIRARCVQFARPNLQSFRSGFESLGCRVETRGRISRSDFDESPLNLITSSPSHRLRRRRVIRPGKNDPVGVLGGNFPMMGRGHMPWVGPTKQWSAYERQDCISATKVHPKRLGGVHIPLIVRQKVQAIQFTGIDKFEAIGPIDRPGP